MHFFVRLNSPRPTFAEDMTEAESLAMKAHFAYWTELTLACKVIVFGPVMASEGAFGCAIVETKSLQEVEEFVANDPAVLQITGFTPEIFLMRIGGERSRPIG